MNPIIAQAPITADSLIQWLTPIIVPLIITYVRKMAPRIPTWMLPAMAPVLGALIDLINSLIVGGNHSMIVGALLGLAGVGVREIKTNLVPPKNPAVRAEDMAPKPVTPPPSP